MIESKFSSIPMLVSSKVQKKPRIKSTTKFKSGRENNTEGSFGIRLLRAHYANSLKE